LKRLFAGGALCAAFISSFVSPFITPAYAAAGFTDFAGQSCAKSSQVTIAKVAKTGMPSGPMKGYVDVTVTLPNGDTASAPMPPELAKKIKAGDKACKATFVDED
jgi:hypothetical protein